MKWKYLIIVLFLAFNIEALSQLLGDKHFATTERQALLISEGKKFYDNLKLYEAEKKFKEALIIKPTSEIHTHLFSTYMVQNKHELAYSHINEAIKLDPNNPKPWKLTAKYFFVTSNGKDLVNTISHFTEASELGDKESGYYLNIIRYLEELRRSIVRGNFSKWYDLTFPLAATSFYNNKQDFINQMSAMYQQLNSFNSKVAGWDYQLPIDFIIEGNKVLTKTKTFTMLNTRSIKHEQGEYLILISLDNGVSWSSMAYDKSYYRLLNKRFTSTTLDKLFSEL